MSNTMWGGGQRGPRPRTPGWFSWRPYVIYLMFLALYLGLTALRFPHKFWHTAGIMLAVTAIGLPLAVLGSWLFSRWLNWMHGRRP